MDESKPYKLTLRIPRDVATEFLAIVQRRGKRNMQEWLDGYIADAIRRDKKRKPPPVLRIRTAVSAEKNTLPTLYVEKRRMSNASRRFC